jgi:hypothetical protein
VRVIAGVLLAIGDLGLVPTLAGGQVVISRGGTPATAAGSFPARNGEIAVVKDHIVRYKNGAIHYGNGTGISIVKPTAAEVTGSSATAVTIPPGLAMGRSYSLPADLVLLTRLTCGSRISGASTRR